MLKKFLDYVIDSKKPAVYRQCTRESFIIRVMSLFCVDSKCRMIRYQNAVQIGLFHQLYLRVYVCSACSFVVCFSQQSYKL